MRTLTGLLILSLLFFTIGCGGGGGGGGGGAGDGGVGVGGGGSGSQSVIIKSISIQGQTSEAVTATVNGVADNDNTVDANYSVRFNFDGGTAANSLPVDPGSIGSTNPRQYNFVMNITDLAGNSSVKTLDVTLNP